MAEPPSGPLPPPTLTAGTPPAPGTRIRASTELPAERSHPVLRTADGLRLQAALALPVGRPPVATLVCAHPLPTAGGTMDSHVYRKAAWRLPDLAGIAVLRFNTRGTDGSEGAFDDGHGERHDLAAAVGWARDRGLPGLHLVGWSFGTELVLRHGADLPGVAGGILLSPPLHRAGEADLRRWGAAGRPLLVLVPELDDYLRPAEAAARFALVPQARVVGVPGAKHLWVGEPAVHRVLSEIVREVVPGAPDLPEEWPGFTGPPAGAAAPPGR